MELLNFSCVLMEGTRPRFFGRLRSELSCSARSGLPILILSIGLIDQQLIAVKQVEPSFKRSIMQRLFFDYVSKDETLSDYEGRYFSPSEAREYAGVLAIHLQYAPEAKYSGWAVVVRDVLGAEICSVLVPPNDDQGVVFKALPSDAIGSRGSDLQVG